MKKFLLSISISLFILVACNNDTKQPANTNNKQQSQVDIPTWDTALVNKASLIQRVTDDVVFYSRIPSIWGLFFSPKNNSLNNALAGKANQNAIASLQQGVENQIAKLPTHVSQSLKIFLHDLRSPIEIAVILPAGSAPTSSQMVLEAQFSFKKITQLNALFKSVAQMAPQIQLTREATAQKPGILSAGPVKVYYQYDESNQRLTALTGMAVLESELKQIINWKHNPDLAIYKLENQIDSSGQGFFQWLNFSRIKPLLQSTIPAQMRDILKKMGLLSTQYIAMGTGVAHGMSNFSFIATGADGLLWKKGFSGQDISKVFSVKRPEFATGFQLPDGKWLESIIKDIAQLQGSANTQKQMIDEWINVNSKVRDAINFSITEILDAIAGQWISVSDKAGNYSMLLASHTDKLKALLGKLDSIDAFTIKNIQSSGTKITEVSFKMPSFTHQQKPSILDRFQSRFYYIEKDNIFYISELPQVLASREQLGANFSIKNWLEIQNIEAEKDNLWLATESDAIPQKNYYFYLQVLQILSDLVEQPIAIESFPTANEIQLPETGKRGFELIFAKNEIGFSLNYESHPGEFLMGSNAMVTVAVVGILAAVAIPAYEDYSKRAIIAGALATASPLKAELNTYYQQNKQWPKANEKQFRKNHPGLNIDSIFFDESMGALIIKMNPVISSATRLSGKYPLLILTPLITGNRILWRCSSVNIPQKWLPKRCKN